MDDLHGVIDLHGGAGGGPAPHGAVSRGPPLLKDVPNEHLYNENSCVTCQIEMALFNKDYVHKEQYISVLPYFSELILNEVPLQ